MSADFGSTPLTRNSQQEIILLHHSKVDSVGFRWGSHNLGAAFEIWQHNVDIGVVVFHSCVKVTKCLLPPFCPAIYHIDIDGAGVHCDGSRIRAPMKRTKDLIFFFDVGPGCDVYQE
jgi:hypothetical protein